MRNVAKALRFPVAGLAKDGSFRETTYPNEASAYPTPRALNVIGECALASRYRGGSRPGLKSVAGAVVASTAKWLWPNGEPIQWPDGKNMVFVTDDSATLPSGAKIILEHPTAAVYRDRLVKCDGAMWMASRTGDFGDFDFGRDAGDVTRAVAGNLAHAGRTGESITALCAFGDARLFIATRRSLAVVSGEPTAALTRLSDNVGIVSADAWCNADGVLYFIGPNGLYAAADGAPILVSKQLPEDLKGWSSAILVYDPERRGIHLFRNEVGATGITDWFYDIENKAFWPLSYPATKMPDAGGRAVINGVNRVIFHCVDGVWRYWDDGQTTDDGTTLESLVTIGPFKCGTGDDVDGMLDALYVTLAESSASVGIGVTTAHTAEGAVANTPSDSAFIASAGYNAVIRPRQRGAWCCIDITASGRWAYESIQANIKTLGRIRP